MVRNDLDTHFSFTAESLVSTGLFIKARHGVPGLAGTWNSVLNGRLMQGSGTTIRSDCVSESARCQHQASIQDAWVSDGLSSQHSVPGSDEPSRWDGDQFVDKDQDIHHSPRFTRQSTQALGLRGDRVSDFLMAC